MRFNEPGKLGWGSVVLAAIVILVPSRAARSAIAKPISQLVPLMKRFFPCSVVTSLSSGDTRRCFWRSTGGIPNEGWADKPSPPCCHYFFRPSYRQSDGVALLSNQPLVRSHISAARSGNQSTCVGKGGDSPGWPIASSNICEGTEPSRLRKSPRTMAMACTPLALSSRCSM
jgi:hypothetical protein